MEQIDLLSILSFLTLIFSAANLILAFSLVVYILTHNLWSSVARTFATLMAFVTIVYGADIILSRELSQIATAAWLKFQWVGIALVPATYLHFSDALLRTTNASSRRRRAAVLISYLVGVLFVFLALFTNLIVGESIQYEPWAPQLVAGPFFWFFMLYFFLTSGWGFTNTLWARSRALTPTSRRRFTYLVASFAAPGLAVYPYLVFTSVPARLSPTLLLSLNLIGTLGVAVMSVIMAYSVAFQGVLAPDRVVKRSFLTYLLRGPLLGVFILITLLTVPRVENVLGAPRETILIFVVVGGIIFYEVLVRRLRPLVDLFVYREDRDEFEIVRSLEERLVTSRDLEQLLENLLTAICDLQRAHNGVVVTVVNGTLHAETTCGEKGTLQRLLERLTPNDLAQLTDVVADEEQLESWVAWETFCLLPLRADDRESTLGFLVIEPSDEAQVLTEKEQQLMRHYIHQAEIALRDRRLQQSIFALLQQLAPQMETLQRWRSIAPFPNAVPDTLESAISPIHDEEFTQWVKDALGHYWGGPRLTESPLLAMQVVRRKLKEHDNNPARALRAVLTDALDALKPEGEREMTTPEWLLYNILDLKYIQGRRARDVAMSLAMSESDLYRKQRAAIDELAKAIGHMEEEIARETTLQTLERQTSEQ
ncbi:MAG: hypothetical protein M3220_06030 [Chloroflexota bacterium]|nr:hypothetical protein [Chloroflexota bacterium]